MCIYIYIYIYISFCLICVYIMSSCFCYFSCFLLFVVLLSNAPKGNGIGAKGS